MTRVLFVLLSLLAASFALAQTSDGPADANPAAKAKTTAPAATAAKSTAARKAAPKAKAAPKKDAGEAASSPAAKGKPASPAKRIAKPNPLAAAYSAMPVAERVAIQNDLIWTGDYNGIADGGFGERALAAVRTFQTEQAGKATGLLSPQERAALAATAKQRRDEVEWRLVHDAETGIRLGLPGKLLTQPTRIKDGARWSSARGEVQIETFRVSGPGSALSDVFDKHKKEPANRQVDYSVLRPDFFVVTGLQGLKRFYVRAHAQATETRGVTILYDQAMQGTMAPVVVSMSSTFAPFPSGAFAGPRKVEYGSAVVIDSAGHAITDRAVVDGCYAITLAGIGRADRIAEDKLSDLALLRVYGVSHLVPIAAGDSSRDVVNATLVGVPDPQAQGGGHETAIVNAQLAAGDDRRKPLAPTPAPGFAGAAAVDPQGRLIGMASVKTPVVAGPATAQSHGAFVPIETIRPFLSKHRVALSDARTPSMANAKAAVARVICVRR